MFRLITRSARLNNGRNLSTRLPTRSTRLFTHSTRLSTGSICFSTRSTRITIRRSFYN